MYSKGQVFLIGATALIAGFGIGYSKAREKFLEALIKAMQDTTKNSTEGEETNEEHE